MKKIAIFLGCLFCLEAFPLAYADTFIDISEGYPYYDQITYVTEQHFMEGKNQRFNPSAPVSKYDFFGAIVRNLYPNLSESSVKLLYTDLGNLPTLYLRKAIETGVLANNKERFDPQGFINRRTALFAIFRMRKINIDKEDHTSRFLDVEDGEMAQIVNRSVNIHLLDPINENFFGNNRPLSRAELANILYILDNKDLLSDSGSNEITVNLSDWAQDEKDLFRMKLINEVYNIINEEYLRNQTVDKDKLVYEALKGMVNSLGDKYSEFWDPTDYQNESAVLEGEIEGIGAFIGKSADGHYVEIVSPIDNSPAQAAGLKPGDLVIRADDHDLMDLNLQEATNFIKGPKGSTVTLLIRRKGVDLEIKIVRDKVKIVDVSWKDLGRGLFYVRLSQFSSTTSDEFSKAIKVMKDTCEIKGLIFDLRNNGGGLLDAAEGVLANFVEEGKPLLYVEYNQDQEVANAAHNQSLLGVPVIVLVNRGSASASEIVAGALQDYKIAKLLGEKTYGKGVVQEIIGFLDDSALKLTTANWLTPLRRTIEKEGLTPDINLIDDESTPQTDEALEKAIEILR